MTGCSNRYGCDSIQFCSTSIRSAAGAHEWFRRLQLSKGCPVSEQESDPCRNPHSKRVSRDHYDAVLFDLDGVVTDTASLHATCWKQMFDEYLRKRAGQSGEAFRPFDLATDYRLYVDGKPRFDGVRDFLTSRGIQLPEGTLTILQRSKRCADSGTARTTWSTMS